MTNKHHNGGEQ